MTNGDSSNNIGILSSDDQSSLAGQEEEREFERELVRVKLECAEAMAAVEQKKLEVKQALQRESQALRELEAAHSYINILEQRVSHF